MLIFATEYAVAIDKQLLFYYLNRDKSRLREDNELNEKKLNGVYKLPWGIFAGTCAMIWSFITVALVAVFVVSSMMIATVGGDDGLSQSWWLIPLYITETLTVIGFVASFVFFVLKKVQIKKSESEAVKTL